MNLADIQPGNLSQISDEQLRELTAQTVEIAGEDRKQNQILFYRPVSAKAQQFHDSKAKVVAAGGGNGSSKTETMLVDLVMCMTGVFPESQRHLIDQKFRGPIQCRLTLESLTTTLEPIIIPKLQWWKWTGVDQQGGARGHWGWIPKNCLIDGEWDRSWTAKTRILRVLCRDPRNPDRVLGDSTLQFMSVDMDPSDFASGDFHICAHDEPPTLPIWRENEARTMRVDGRMLLAMTWPDDPAIQVDWLYDEVYEPGKSGSDPSITWLELWTTENPHLRQEAVALQEGKWSTEITNVRIFGRPIRFSNRVHPEFTDNTKTWCFPCGKSTVKVLDDAGKAKCGACQSHDVVDYNHVLEFDSSDTWPTVFLLDPHPRKPHMFLWVQIDPADDWHVINEGKVEGDCVEVRNYVHQVETDMRLFVPMRLMDPNMGASPSGQKREVTWQDEFASAGLHCELASDVDVGRARLNTMLKPDRDTLRPRCHVHSRCRDTIYQLNRYSWANYSKNVDRDPKQTPKDRNDDFPTLLKYLANADPVFNFLRGGAGVFGRPGQRKGAY